MESVPNTLLSPNTNPQVEDLKREPISLRDFFEPVKKSFKLTIDLKL